mgnify:CR=1 FL=1
MDKSPADIQSLSMVPTQNRSRLHAELVAFRCSPYAESVAGLRRIGRALYIEQNIPEQSYRTLLRIFRTREREIFSEWGCEVVRVGCRYGNQQEAR